MDLTASLSTTSILFASFMLGLLHAFEADHLAAVSTIVSEKKSLLAASMIGGLWGMGHTISLLIVGTLVIFLKLQISDRVEANLEACVGVMLVFLGINVLRKMIGTFRGQRGVHNHSGGKFAHEHPNPNQLEENWRQIFSPRSVIIGMLHGLAGSAALMLLIIPTIDSPLIAISYILIFGIGSIGGMMLMSSLICLPFRLTAARFSPFNNLIRLAAALFSFSVGLMLIYEKLFTV